LSYPISPLNPGNCDDPEGRVCGCCEETLPVPWLERVFGNGIGLPKDVELDRSDVTAAEPIGEFEPEPLPAAPFDRATRSVALLPVAAAPAEGVGASVG